MIMKKICKSLISLILVASFVLGMASAFVFAASGGSSEPEIDRTNETTELVYNYWNHIGGQFPGAPLNASEALSRHFDYYAMSISLGHINNAQIEAVYLSYFTSEDSKYPYTQIIDVNKKQAETITKAMMDLYLPEIFYKKGSVSGSSVPSYGKYEDAAKYLVPDVNTNSFPSPFNKSIGSGSINKQQENSIISFESELDNNV